MLFSVGVVAMSTFDPIMCPYFSADMSFFSPASILYYLLLINSFWLKVLKRTKKKFFSFGLSLRSDAHRYIYIVEEEEEEQVAEDGKYIYFGEFMCALRHHQRCSKLSSHVWINASPHTRTHTHTHLFDIPMTYVFFLYRMYRNHRYCRQQMDVRIFFPRL